MTWPMLHLSSIWPYLQTLDQAGKACQGQNIQLITHIDKVSRKKFYKLGPGPLSESNKRIYIRKVLLNKFINEEFLKTYLKLQLFTFYTNGIVYEKFFLMPC